MKQILIIEDDVAILRGLKDNLEYESFKVLTATDGEQGYCLIQEKKPDLIILDLMLPKMNGYELCRKVRKEGISIPILMLTARGEETDRIMGLDLGADDYLTKPFSMLELLARIRAIMRRIQKAKSGDFPKSLQFGSVFIDFKCFKARKGEKVLELSRKEFGVLRFLAAREGEAVTRNELLDEVWGYDQYPTTRTVDNHIASLRNKLEDDPSNPKHLITIHGVGYKIVLDE
ncbi:response regulator transcription factor [bacterium]|nr:response regulator transcription factor [bacterium]